MPNDVDETATATAWTAMTQLWHDSGDFQFDEAVLGRIHDGRGGMGLGMGMGMNGGIMMGFEGVQDVPGLKAEGLGMGLGETSAKGIGNGTGDSGPMLWNQLG